MSALVLAGGGGRRLGQDKPAALVDGVPLLDRVLGSLGEDCDIVVVGPPRVTTRRVSFVQEQPPGGGPVAAIGAGLARLRGDTCFLLAADLPFLTAEALAQLAAKFGARPDRWAAGNVAVAADAAGAVERGAPTRDGVVAVDGAGKEQPLLSYWRTDALRRALPPVPAGARLREMLSGLSYGTVRLTGERPPDFDCDTPEQLERARTWA